VQLPERLAHELAGTLDLPIAHVEPGQRDVERGVPGQARAGGLQGRDARRQVTIVEEVGLPEPRVRRDLLRVELDAAPIVSTRAFQPIRRGVRGRLAGRLVGEA